MKGLLQSKKFRKNLGKWLFMYAGVMLLLTTVITYSKYISSFEGKDKAQTARFELSMECTDNNGSTCGNTPLIEVIKDHELKFNYSFTVDPSKLDVKSNLKLLIFVDKRFIIENISTSSTGNFNKDNPDTTEEGNKIYTYDTTINSNTANLNFGVTVSFNGAYINELSTIADSPTNVEVVSVKYIVEQINS